MTGASIEATQAGRPKPSAAIEPYGESSSAATSTTSTSAETSKRGGWASRTKRIQLPPGSSLERTDKIVRQVNDIALSLKAKTSVSIESTGEVAIKGTKITLN